MRNDGLGAAKVLTEISKRLECEHTSHTDNGRMYYNGRWHEFCRNCGRVRIDQGYRFHWIKFSEIDQEY